MFLKGDRRIKQVRFQAQLAILKQQGLRNAMADWRVVGGTQVVSAASVRAMQVPQLK